MRIAIAFLLQVAVALALVLATLLGTMMAAALFRADGFLFPSHAFEHVAVLGNALSLVLLGTVLFRRAPQPGPGRNSAAVTGGRPVAQGVLLLGIALHASVGGMLLFQVMGLYIHLSVLSREAGLFAGVCFFVWILARYVNRARAPG